MPNQKNISNVKELSDKLSKAKSVYFTDYLGLNVSDVTSLRKKFFDSNVEYIVVKNTLLAKAMEASDHNFGELTNILKGNTSLMFSESGNAPAKVIKNFRKKSDKPILKGAFIEEAIYLGDDQLDKLVAIKSKDELIGEIITLLHSPIKNVISSLQSGGGKLSGILKSLSERSSW